MRTGVLPDARPVHFFLSALLTLLLSGFTG